MACNKILIVEDDRTLQRALEIRLKSNGYEVLLAADGETGVELARKDKPDIIILDLGLPGIDGFGVIKELRAQTETAKTPIVILTAQGSLENLTKSLEADVVTLLEKPVDNEELLTTIRMGLKQEAGKPG